jgi:hypothetical protein
MDPELYIQHVAKFVRKHARQKGTPGVRAKGLVIHPRKGTLFESVSFHDEKEKVIKTEEKGRVSLSLSL